MRLLLIMVLTLVAVAGLGTAYAMSDADKIDKLESEIEYLHERIGVLESKKNGSNDAKQDDRIEFLESRIEYKQSLIDELAPEEPAHYITTDKEVYKRGETVYASGHVGEVIKIPTVELTIDGETAEMGVQTDFALEVEVVQHYEYLVEGETYTSSDDLFQFDCERDTVSDLLINSTQSQFEQELECEIGYGDFRYGGDDWVDYDPDVFGYPQFDLDEDGSWTMSFTLPEDMPPGQYSIDAWAERYYEVFDPSRYYNYYEPTVIEDEYGNMKIVDKKTGYLTYHLLFADNLEIEWEGHHEGADHFPSPTFTVE